MRSPRFDASVGRHIWREARRGSPLHIMKTHRRPRHVLYKHKFKHIRSVQNAQRSRTPRTPRMLRGVVGKSLTQTHTTYRYIRNSAHARRKFHANISLYTGCARAYLISINLLCTIILSHKKKQLIAINKYNSIIFLNVIYLYLLNKKKVHFKVN